MASNSCHTSAFCGSQLRFEYVQRGVEPRLHGRYWAGKDFGHLLELESLVNLQDHGLALVCVQFAQRRGYSNGKLDGKRRRGACGNALAGEIRLRHRLSLGPPLAERGKGFVVRDAKQPGRKSRRIVELLQVLISLQENILAEVQSVFAIPDDPQQVIVDALFPSGNQEVIRLHISPARLAYQVGVLDRPKDQCSGSLWNDVPHTQKVCGV